MRRPLRGERDPTAAELDRLQAPARIGDDVETEVVRRHPRRALPYAVRLGPQLEVTLSADDGLACRIVLPFEPHRSIGRGDGPADRIVFEGVLRPVAIGDAC